MNILTPIYRQDGFPLFQNRTYDTFQEAKECLRGDIRLVEDPETGLVFNEAFSSALMCYDIGYQNEQALSPFFQHHLQEVAGLVDRLLGRENLVEVGCGKGTFLEMLLSLGYDVTGFDPAYEGKNERVRREAFAPGVMKKATGVILRHVLEHVPDPVRFLEDVCEANGGSGRIYVEVPCFDWICAHRAWFDIYYEHVNYFRRGDFLRMFDGVIESGHLFRGQYLYVVADLARLRRLRVDSADRGTFPSVFLSESLLMVTRERGGSAIWGASSKGVVFALIRERIGCSVDMAIDINPAKQGRFLPATGLRVFSPEEAMTSLPEGATVYVMNSNYLAEIRRMSGDRFRYVAIDHEG